MAKRLRKSEKIDLLGRQMLFETCTRKELEDIAGIMSEAERPEGSFLTREGHDGGLMFILVDGTADVIAEGKTIGHLKAGDVVGELSLIDGQARSATVVATSPVHVLQLVADDFGHLINNSPKFVKALLRNLSLKVREMDALTS